jgi:drug/metabolite transporter (DMT)-like permease
VFFYDIEEKGDTLNSYIGEIAGLGTSVCWTFTSILFTIASQRIGSLVVNRVRLVLAVIFLLITHLAVQGEWLPLQAGTTRWFWLGLSGVIGLTLGDLFLFQSFVWIGPRRAMLLLSLAPIIGALVAWVTLGETLSLLEMAAVALTVGGVAWVVMEKENGNGFQSDRRHYWLGIALGIAAALGQALGLIASKVGMAGDFAPLSANMIRMLVAMVVMWAYTLLRGEAQPTFKALADRQASLATLGGSLVGPFIGVWLSLISVQLTRVGIASTLMALPPVLVLPLSHWVFKEEISWQAVAGTAVAIGGVALLFLI